MGWAGIADAAAAFHPSLFTGRSDKDCESPPVGPQGMDGEGIRDMFLSPCRCRTFVEHAA